MQLCFRPFCFVTDFTNKHHRISDFILFLFLFEFVAMANNICSSFLRRCLPGPTKPLCRPTPAAKGVHHLINKAASRHFHHHQPGAQKYFEFDCKAAPVRTSCQRSVHQKCLLNLNLSVATSNYCASKSLFWKNLHTSISKLKFDAETDNKERLCKDKDDDVNLVIDNVSPEIY